MTHSRYVWFEMGRTARNVRFMVFSLVFPMVLYIVTVSGNRHVTNFAGTGLSFALYYMVGMVAWGSMVAVTAGGARISVERSIGWVRQLRLTPLRTRTYFLAKVLSGYALAVLSIVILYALGIAFGVRLPLANWLQMTFLIIVGLVPFAALGVWLGHVLSPDNMGPVLGGVTALFALLGGAWGPLTSGQGGLNDFVQLLPSYWLVHAAQSGITGEWWPLKAWIVILVWTVAFTRLAQRAYRNDSLRV